MGLLRSVFSKLNNTLGGLVEVGFEYVTGECNDGGKLLRKRKQNHYRFAVSSGNSPKVAGVRYLHSRWRCLPQESPFFVSPSVLI